MASYIINGGKRLEGEIDISGSKNASLPIIAACLLNKGITKLYNVPNIHDVQIMLKILKVLGCKIKKNSGKIIIDSRKINKKEIPDDLMNQMRSSVILAGALISRNKEVVFSYPGGCDIGSRPIDLHLEGFKKIGINIEEESGYIKCNCDKILSSEITLDFPSVGATENIMLASVYGEGTTIIKNAAREPEIVDLQNFLVKMGAKVTGAGESEIVIEGIKQIKKDVSYTIMPDRIEAGTLLCATAITGGKIKINKVEPIHIGPVISKLEESGCKISVEKNSVILEAPKRLKAVDIKTMPYPGFPTDMQSIFTGMLTTAKGTSMIVENIFENRYKYTNELKRMGAKITTEGKVAIVKGTKKLVGTTVEATDLRGGATLVLAGLVAKGKTTVTNIEHILRGYEALDNKLNKIGANIQLKNSLV